MIPENADILVDLQTGTISLVLHLAPEDGGGEIELEVVTERDEFTMEE